MQKILHTCLFCLFILTGIAQDNQKYKYVGIQLTPNSVDMIILNIYDKGDGEYYYKILKDSSIYIPFIDFSEKSMNDAKYQINSFFEYATNKGIPNINITVVVNSGVPIEAKRKNKEEALSNFIFNTSSRINPIATLDPKTEAEYSFLSSIIEKFRKEAVMIDIDGANTKGGIYTDAEFTIFSPFNINWGFNSLKNATPNNSSITEFNKNIERSVSQISDEISGTFKDNTLLNNRDYCIIGGDLSRVISILQNPDNNEGFLYQEISLSKIKDLKRNIISNYDKLTFSGNAKTLEGQRDIEKLKEKYDQKTLLAGVNYLEKIAQLLSTEKQKRFYLVRYNSSLACYVINTFFK